jgi:hypothetical protein
VPPAGKVIDIILGHLTENESWGIARDGAAALRRFAAVAHLPGDAAVLGRAQPD